MWAVLVLSNGLSAGRAPRSRSSWRRRQDEIGLDDVFEHHIAVLGQLGQMLLPHGVHGAPIPGPELPQSAGG